MPNDGADRSLRVMPADNAIIRSVPAEGIFAGREGEFGELVAAIDAAAGDGGAVLLRGEAGIGKSKLLARGVDVVMERGWHVLHVRPDELEHGIPYAAFGHALSYHGFPAAGELGQLADALAGALDVGAQQRVASVHAAAARLFSALRDEAPTVIALDDLHLVDDDTVVLVARLLRLPARNPLVLLGALRKPGVEPQGATGLLLERLARDELLRVVELGPMTDAGTESLLAAVLTRSPDGPLVRLVQARSEGNPFFAVQTVLDLAEDGALDVDGDRCRLSGQSSELSADRRTAVLHRVLRVGADARRLSRAIALVGSVGLGRLGVAAELASLSPDEAEVAFDALVERGILRSGGGDGSYRFCHPLVRDALYQEIGPAERHRWHRQAAEWLGRLPPSPEVEAEIALHVRETAEVGDEESIVVLSRAAERACTAAPRSAIPWFHHALAIIPPEDARHADLTARLARALFLAGRPRDAVEAGRAAVARLPGAPTRQRVATLVIEALVEIQAIEEAAEMIEAERAQGTSSLRLTAQAAYVFAVAGRLAEAEEAAAEATVGLGAASPRDRVNALVHLMHMRSVASGFAALPMLLQSLASAAEDAPLTARLNAHAAMAYLLAVQGETRACSEAIVRGQELLAESGWTLYRAELATAQARNAANLGDWDTALSIIESVAGELEEAGSLVYLTVLRDIETEIHAHRGDWVAAQRAARAVTSGHPTFTALVSARAALGWLSGDVDGARDQLTRQLAHQVPAGVRAALMVNLADVEVEAGDPAVARAILDEVEVHGSQSLDHGSFIVARLALGRANGDVDAVVEAAKVADEHGLALLRGRARLYLGALGEEPQQNLGEAVRLFQSLGATPWRRRAAAELRTRGLKVPRRRRRGPELLTDTETQIARLVQLGRPNREIALTVSLSVRTVEAYLSRIYAKTGCANRFELARALDTGDLDNSGPG